MVCQRKATVDACATTNSASIPHQRSHDQSKMGGANAYANSNFTDEGDRIRGTWTAPIGRNEGDCVGDKEEMKSVARLNHVLCHENT